MLLAHNATIVMVAGGPHKNILGMTVNGNEVRETPWGYYGNPRVVYKETLAGYFKT